MPIPDPEKLWSDLEKVGVAEVRRRLATGVYSDDKIALVKEWIRRKEQEHNSHVQNEEETTAPTLVDKYLTRLKNNPLIAILIVVAIVVIGLGEFAGYAQKLLSIWVISGNDLPDLTICKVDIGHSRIDICNVGTGAAATEKLYLAWSEGWYTKPEWNNGVLVSTLPYIGNRDIQPGEKLPIRPVNLTQSDDATEFMIDPANLIEEKDEANNCVDIRAKVIPCRPNREFVTESTLPPN